MQLPRGTFREIKKNVPIESLLHALNGEKFSGIASISSQDQTGTLVFKAGKCILVKVQKSCGDDGWDEIEKAESKEVDAVLSLLDDAQINLALEFNKTCRILKSRMHPPIKDPPQPASLKSHDPSGFTYDEKPAVPPKSAGKNVSPPRAPFPQTPGTQVPAHTPPIRSFPFTKTAAPVSPSSPPPVLRHEKKERDGTGDPGEKGDDPLSFENDFDTFDTMDFENVTEKIRSDCKTMIKQLHLDHLMER